MQCPFCNAEVQATQVVHVYWSLVDGKWVDKSRETAEVRYYCKNDHTFRLTDKRGKSAHFPGIPQEMLN